MALNIYYHYPWLYLSHFRLPPFGGWLRRNHDSIMRHLPAEAPGRILEVGGSTGQLTHKLADRYPDSEIVSIDRSASMHRMARAKAPPKNVSHLLMDFWEVEGRFDLVVAAGCWEFFDLLPSLDKVDKLLKPAGYLLINDMAPSLFGRAHQAMFTNAFHTRLWLHRPGQFQQELKLRGYLAGWETVNSLEGSYTLWAQRQEGEAG